MYFSLAAVMKNRVERFCVLTVEWPNVVFVTSLTKEKQLGAKWNMLWTMNVGNRFFLPENTSTIYGEHVDHSWFVNRECVCFIYSNNTNCNTSVVSMSLLI